MAGEPEPIAVLLIEEALCSAEAVRAVASRYEPRVTVAVSSLAGGRWEVRLLPGEGQPEFDGPAVAAAFRRDLLDQQLRLDLEKRAGPLREAIYRRAFEPAERRRWWWWR